MSLCGGGEAIGNTGRSSAAVLAEKCARLIATSTKGARRAICIDPRGRVSVEAVTSAADADLIGVYSSPRIGAWVSLAALIERDIKAATGERRRAA